MRHLVVLLSMCVLFSNSVKLPASFIKCYRKNPDLNSCLLKAAQNGATQLTKPFDEVNLPSLNPLEIAEIVVGSREGPVNLDQNFKNCKLYGLDKVQFNNIEHDWDKKIVSASGNFPEIKMKCDYELNGQVLLLPVVGKGPSTVILKNVNMSFSMNYEEVKKRGKTHFKFLSSKLTLDPGFVSFNFENLFGGDKQLGDNINKVLNDNWQQVFSDVKSGYTEVFNRVIRGLFNDFHGKVSIEESLD